VLGGWAEYYARSKKWAVLPVHRLVRTERPGGIVRACSCSAPDCLSPGKHAAIALEDAYVSIDFDEGGRLGSSSAWGERNIGVVTGAMSGLVAVNIQPEIGEASWHALVEQKIGGDIGLVGTLTVATGGGGRILLYATPPGLVIEANRMELDSYPGVSILGDGGYVILPPSLHASGTTYGWDYGMSADSKILPLPPGLLVHLVSEGAAAGITMSDLSEFVDSDYVHHVERVNRTLTDLGNARRLVDRYGWTLKYTDGLGWRAWINDRWTDRLVESGYVRQCAEEIPKLIADERHDLERARILKREEDMTEEEARLSEIIEKRIKALKMHEHNSRSDSKINAAVRRAASDPRVLVAADTWDRDPFLFGVPNGMIDLSTGELLPMEYGKLISKYGRVIYEPGASSRTVCPEFWDFIGFITAGDDEYAEYLQHWAGYSLTGSMREKALVFCQGPGNTGKTTFADAMLGICGDYGVTVDTRLVSKEDRSGNMETSTTDLIGRRFAVAPDIPTNDFNADFLKKISGGDTLTGRRMHQNSITFISPAKLWIFSNHYPNIKDKQLMERMRVLPFTNQSGDKNRARSLWTKPETHTEGRNGVAANKMMRAMLDWAVEGARKNLALGHMPECAVASAAKAEYETTGDIFMPFVVERCRTGDDLTIALNDLYVAYDSWNIDTKYSRFTPSRSAFKNIVTERGYRVVTEDLGEIVYGLAVKPMAMPGWASGGGGVSSWA
jgi:P4 family phage/plasmid primase-like protien